MMIYPPECASIHVQVHAGAVRPDYLPDLRKGSPDAPLYVPRVPAARYPSADLLDQVQRDLPAATTEACDEQRRVADPSGAVRGAQYRAGVWAV